MSLLDFGSPVLLCRLAGSGCWRPLRSFGFLTPSSPGPISWLDKHLHGGFGIMVDDVAAGLASLICLQVAAVWLP
jgi:phosphatidylglycerophosphatase A